MSDISENQFQKIERVPAPGIVLEQVKNLILNQRFNAGDRLPAERALAEMIGVSRPSLREALKTLEAFGIVQIKHGSGVYVREPNLDFATFPITVMLNKGTELVRELIEVREIIEVEVTVLAARRAKEEDLDELERFLNNRKSLKEMEKLEGMFDFEFERIIAKSTGNRLLMSIQEATHTLWSIGLKKIGFKPLPVRDVDREHWDIFNAIKSGDEGAAKKAITFHLAAPLRELDAGRL